MAITITIENHERTPVLSKKCSELYNEFLRIMDANEDILCQASHGHFEYGLSRLEDASKSILTLFRGGYIPKETREGFERFLRGYRLSLMSKDFDKVKGAHDAFNNRIRKMMIDEVLTCEIKSREFESMMHEALKKKREPFIPRRGRFIRPQPEKEEEIGVKRPPVREVKPKRRAPPPEEEEIQFKLRPLPVRKRSSYNQLEEIDEETESCLKAIARTYKAIKDEEEAIKLYGDIAEEAITDEMRDTFLSVQKDEERHKDIFKDVLRSLLNMCVRVTRR